jgi:peptidoglycan hydrolase-like protein with peptidoglycan-binding domain
MKIKLFLRSSIMLALAAVLLLATTSASAGRIRWWPYHKQGDSGRNVVTIQYLLRARGYTITLNGSFDAQTDTAVRQFQRDRGLTADGVVGNDTWEALVITVKKGSTNTWAVKGVQDQLKNRYGYNITIDGIFGSATDAAVRDRQSKKGLWVDGVVGTNTWNALVNYGKVEHTSAKQQLTNAGITVTSSGNCSDRYTNTCTSLEQIRQATINGIISFKNASGCSIRVQGGTETGHADGTYSHWNGYKIDIGRDCVSNYIYSHFTYIGGGKYKDANGNIYYDEDSAHWDITYY